MAIFTSKQLSALNVEPLFTTVDNEGQLLETTGYYIITRRESEISPEIQIDKQNYSEGVAAYNELYQEGDNIYVYPNNYFGTNGPKGDIKLQDTITVQKKQAEKQRNFITNKLGDKKVL